MSWKQRNADFCKAQTDAQMAYIEAEREVKQLRAENEKLRELAKSAWVCVNRHVSCDECRMSCGGCTLQSAMHELGIEVQP